MSDDFDTIVFGDGVLTIPFDGDEEMATDLPENVAQQMMVLSAGQISQGTGRMNGVFDAVMGAIAGTVQSNYSEVGVLEGRAVSGVNATPIAGPTNPAGP